MTPRAARASTNGTTAPRVPRLGERLRQLRVAAGLTQTDLAGDRFSKEYISQIERGKTRPTHETVEWLALRLGVDAGFLANGVSTDERGRVETRLAQAEAMVESEQNDEALVAYDEVRAAVAATGLPELDVRALTGEAKARARLGDVRRAIELLTRARGLAEGPGFSDVERAEVVFLLGVARYQLGSVATAIGLFGQALDLADRSGLPCDVLRSNILNWRSRCFRRQRDYEAAREDVERALELAESLGDGRTMGHLYFQASLLAERDGHYVLARSYAERAKAQAPGSCLDLIERQIVDVDQAAGGGNTVLHPVEEFCAAGDAGRLRIGGKRRNDAVRVGRPLVCERQHGS